MTIAVTPILCWSVPSKAVKQFAHDLALQIAAAKPEAVRREEVDSEKLEKAERTGGEPDPEEEDAKGKKKKKKKKKKMNMKKIN